MFHDTYDFLDSIVSSSHLSSTQLSSYQAKQKPYEPGSLHCHCAKRDLLASGQDKCEIPKKRT